MTDNAPETLPKTSSPESAEAFKSPALFNLFQAELERQIKQAEAASWSPESVLKVAIVVELFQHWEGDEEVSGALGDLRRKLDPHLLTQEERAQGVTLDEKGRSQKIAQKMEWDEVTDDPDQAQNRVRLKGLELVWESRGEELGLVELKDLVDYLSREQISTIGGSDLAYEIYTDFFRNIKEHPEALEQMALSPAEVLRLKLLIPEAIFDDRVKLTDYQRQRQYIFSPEQLFAYLTGEAEFVFVTEQKGLEADVPQFESYFTNDYFPGFLAGIDQGEAQVIFQQLVEERGLLRQASRTLLGKAKEAGVDDLMMPLPAHFLEEKELVSAALEDLRKFAVVSELYDENRKLTQTNRRSLTKKLGEMIASFTVDKMFDEAYSLEVSWIIRNLAEVLEVWWMKKLIRERMGMQTFTRQVAENISQELRDLHENRERLQAAWEVVTKGAKAEIPFTKRYDHLDKLAQAMFLSRLENDRTALRLYGPKVRVVDLGENLDKYRIIVNDRAFEFRVSSFQDFGYMDDEFNFTEKGIIKIAESIKALLAGESPDGTFDLVDEAGRPKVSPSYSSNDAYVSPIGTTCICGPGKSPFDKSRSPYTLNAEQVEATAYTVSLEEEGIFWEDVTKLYNHFGNDGKPGLRRFEKIWEAWQARKKDLSDPDERELLKEEEIPEIKQEVELIFDRRGLPERAIVHDAVSPDQLKLEKIALKAIEKAYEGHYRKSILPLVDQVMEEEYGSQLAQEYPGEAQAMRVRARQALVRASKLHIYRVMAEALAKSTFDDHTVSICVAPEERDLRLYVSELVRYMVMLGENRQEKESSFDMAKDRFIKTGEFEAAPINRAGVFHSLLAASHDIQAARHGLARVARITRKIPPGAENAVQFLTKKFNYHMAESGSGGPSQISQLRVRNPEFLRGLSFITSASWRHSLPEVAIVFSREGAIRTIRTKITEEQQAVLLSQFFQNLAKKLNQPVDQVQNLYAKGEIAREVAQEEWKGVLAQLKEEQREYERQYVLHDGFLLTSLIFAFTGSKGTREEALAHLESLRNQTVAEPAER